jgi:hypothetical protein
MKEVAGLDRLTRAEQLLVEYLSESLARRHASALRALLDVEPLAPGSWIVNYGIQQEASAARCICWATTSGNSSRAAARGTTNRATSYTSPTRSARWRRSATPPPWIGSSTTAWPPRPRRDARSS